jgi:hypothetical protein
MTPSGSVIAGHQLAVSPILLGILFEKCLAIHAEALSLRIAEVQEYLRYAVAHH